jgi:hypothetical protein
VFLGYLIGNWQSETVTLPPTSASGFVVSNLSIQPEEVQPDDIVAITLSIANTHDTWGIYSLVLKINGVKETEGQAMVAAGSTDNVTFCVSREEPGIYSVFINGLSGSFTVVAPREEEVNAEVVIKEVEVTRWVEVIKEVPVKLRNFESVQELKDWLQGPMRIHLVANSEGVVNLEGVCGEVAISLQDRAIEDGYKMSIETLDRGQYYKWYGEWLKKDQLHAINMAIIGNEAWFIDFLADKRVWVGALIR